MRASLGFTVWTIVVFSCFFEISKAQCDKSCDNNVRVTTTTTTITAENCSLSDAESSQNSPLVNLQPGTVYSVFANCSSFNCCLNATTQPEKITNLTANSRTSSLILKWTDPPGNVSYYKVKCTGGGQTRSLNTSQSPVVIENLTSGAEYEISVTAVAADGETEGSEVTISQYTIPTKPVNVIANYRGTSSLNISWSLPEGNVNHYVVQLDRDSNQTEASWLLFTGLSPGRLYTVSVTAVAGHLNNTSKLSVFATYPLPPESIRVLNRTNSSLTLTWGIDQQMLDAPNITYSIAYEGGGFGLDPITSMFNSTKLTSLNSGTQYEIQVTAVGPENLRSTGVNISTCTNPNPVLDLTAYPHTNTSVKVEWSFPQDSKNYSYNILTYNASGNAVNSQKVQSSSTFVTGLNPGTKYKFIVTTLFTSECFSTDKEVSIYTKPNPVANLQYNLVNPTTVTLIWDNFINYEPACTYLVQAKQGTNVAHNDSTAAQNYTFTGLTPGELYTLTVIAEVEKVQSEVEAITVQTSPAAVTITEVSGSTTHLIVSWSEADGKVDNYTVRLYKDNDTQIVETKEDLDNSTRDTSFSGLTPGQQYCAVVTIKRGDLTNHSSTACNTTWPALVTIREITGTTTNLTVSWSEANGTVDSYTVLLYNNNNNSQIVGTKPDLSNNARAATFSDLNPGVIYCAVVITKSGQLENKTSEFCDATFPNPPRNIQVTSQTEQSLTFTWHAPEDMQPDQYYFNVTTHTGSEETRNFSLTLDKLDSGSQYNIAIVTVGAKGYKSQEVEKQAYTRPYSVTELRQTEITADSVTLVWNQTERKSDYTYSVAVSVFGFLNSTNVTSFTQQGLDSGTNYSFTVTTRAADDTEAAPVTVSYFTRPYSIEDLVADTINTTAIKLEWKKPVQYKPEYRYLVETTGCPNITNPPIPAESVEISGLIPGTGCSFCVTVMAENGIKGQSNCTSQYTMPEKAHPLVSNMGSNSSLWVSWDKPPGNVEFYIVNVNHIASERLDSSRRNYTFVNLPAGKLYTVVVITQSGPKPFTALSEPVRNATFPNSPGAINVLSQTTNSIHIGWEEAPLMTGAQFYYHLEIPGVQVKNTTLTNYTFDQLVSGTSYSISVKTVAAMGYASEAIWRHMVTTRPFAVRALQADPSEETVNLSWSNPEGYQSSYSYRLTLLDSNGNILRNETTKTRSYHFSRLDPGTSYRFKVTTETSDGTQGAPVDTSKCTNASPVEFVGCDAPNVKNARITWSWKIPKGHYSNFTVKLDDSQEEVQRAITFFKSNLKHFTNYTLGVTTQSCGESSNIVRNMCQTGITNPPIPKDYQSMISLVDVKFNMFTIKIDRNMLDKAHGPIKYVGVLVTEEVNSVDTTKMAQYLENHYEVNKDEPYLATIMAVADSDVKRRRSILDPLSLTVGDETKWNDYYNGLLKPTEYYKYAIVLFTDLQVKPKLINGQTSLFSVTKFDNFALLPQDPVVIGLVAGLTLAILCIMLLVLIIFIIYWRRLSHKQSSAQRNSIRTKVRSAPVRVEDYEAYYKKQKADSNCGFAAEYEEVKVVGTQQSKNNALNPENKSKNRYNNVLPYDLSRVKLSIINGNPLDDYINANYIPGYNSKKEFIAAQGPLPTTVSDFWRMIWEKNAHTIVMLTRCNEQGRVKCEQYWTPGTKHYDNITVTTTSEIPLDDWTIRDFDIKNVKTAETRSVRHFHFTAWPDHGVPETTELLISFRHLVREHMDQYRHSPTVVHCSAGVGRTGTFIAIDRLIFQIERENVVDIYGIVYDMRMHRALMVQTEDQYIFLNQCALDIIRSRTGTNVDLIYQNTTALSIYENIELQNK